MIIMLDNLLYMGLVDDFHECFIYKPNIVKDDYYQETETEPIFVCQSQIDIQEQYSKTTTSSTKDEPGIVYIKTLVGYMPKTALLERGGILLDVVTEKEYDIEEIIDEKEYYKVVLKRTNIQG